MSSRSNLEGRLYGQAYSSEQIREAFCSGHFPVAVYGLGKMGLPLAGVFADVSGNVIGADIDPEVVETINDGRSHVKREPGLDDLVETTVQNGALSATTDPIEAAKEATIHVVIVPTPITDDKEPDLSILDSVIEDIGEGLAAGDLVIIECTVPPRTTENRVTPKLVEVSGLNREEFGVAFCPERTASGRALKDIRGAYPKVVGGIDEESTEIAASLYEEINDNGVIPVSDATTAECVKVFEGLYRDVNIALANELATFSEEFGIDINEAIEIANTAPYIDLHEPGPGVGGHCIPFYPYFVINEFETDAPMLRTAREVNDSMPDFTVEKVREELSAEGTPFEEVTALVLGLTYRPGVEEIRAAPALPIAEELSEMGAEVYGVDPVLDDFDAFALDPLPLSAIYEHSYDVVVVVTPHDEFDRIRWEDIEREDGQLIVVDGRDSYDLTDTNHRVYTIGGGYE